MNNNVLHVYGQAAWHDDVVIAGTADALQALLCQLAMVLNDIAHNYEPDPTRAHTFFVSDGEGFRIRIVQVEDDGKLAVPYSDKIAREERPGAVWP
jgi:hypothetical protein